MTDWKAVCREERINPDEVRLVYQRYDAQQRYRGGAGSDADALGQWFRFYRMEKASDSTAQAGPSPSGCSVDSDAVNNACIERPGAFFKALKAYDASLR